MMAYSEDQIALAAEYALGTLDAEERLQAETMMSADKEFAAMAEAWQTGWVALRGLASNLMEQPWYAAIRDSLEHPARWGIISSVASLTYVLGLVALRRLLALPAREVAHANS